MKNRFSLILFFTISFIACVLDQITKNFFVKILERNNGNITVLNFLSLTLVKNYGIVFGLFNEQKINIFLIIFSLIVIFFIPLYLFKIEKIDRYSQISLALIEGGILGNLIDRIRNGYVVDFINFHFWPVFNFADSFIVVGIFLFFIKQLKGQ